VVAVLPSALVEYFEGDLDAVIASLGDISKLASEAQVFAQVSKES
jgi:hypothetical protein